MRSTWALSLYQHPRALSSSWRLSSTELFSVLIGSAAVCCRSSDETPWSPPPYYLGLHASAHRLPVFSTSDRRDVLLSAISRLLLPALDFRTVYLLTSGLPRHSQRFVNLTQTLCYSYVAIVVLEVTFT